METSRLEAFSDAIIAIIITIMVLQLAVPHGADLESLKPLVPTFIAYVLSFRGIATYWNNHHHLMRTAKRVNAKIMWSNLDLLFWLSLIPFFTAWLGQNYREPWPTALYGSLMLITAGAYQLLQRAIVSTHGKGSGLAESLGNDLKGKLSLAFYLLAIVLAFVNHWLSDALYILVALIWFIPDRRLESIAR